MGGGRTSRRALIDQHTFLGGGAIAGNLNKTPATQPFRVVTRGGINRKGCDGG